MSDIDDFSFTVQKATAISSTINDIVKSIESSGTVEEIKAQLMAVIHSTDEVTRTIDYLKNKYATLAKDNEAIQVIKQELAAQANDTQAIREQLEMKESDLLRISNELQEKEKSIEVLEKKLDDANKLLEKAHNTNNVRI